MAPPRPLVNAITAANSDTATGGCPAGSGPDALNLVAGSTHTLTAVNNNTYGNNGLPVVKSPITIEGNGSTINRHSSAPAFRIFAINSSGNLTLNDTTVSGGVAVGSFPANFGGGVYNRGTLTLTRSTVSGNSAAAFGGGVSSSGGSFGDPYTKTSSTATLTNSTVSGNSAGLCGGGVSNGGGTEAPYNSTATLTNSTVSGNNSAGNGGGVCNGFDSTLTLTHSTVSGNSAVNRGGGVYNFGDNVTATLRRSLISGNTASTTPPPTTSSGWEVFNRIDSIAANDFNLFGQSGIPNAQAFGGFGGFTPGMTDITATSDGVTPTALAAILDSTLMDNGGPTDTHALVTGSPAIDAYPPDGSGSCAVATDQRGVVRPQGAACDIGAFELALADLSVTKVDSPDPVTVGQNLTYTLTVTNSGPDPATGVTLDDTLPGGVSFVSATPSQGTCTGTSTVSCNLGGLASSASAQVAIVVTPTVPGPLTNQARVTADQDDPDSTDTTATADTTVNAVPALACNGLTPTKVGTAGNNVLLGTAGNDVILGLGGNDVIIGGNGNDTICGGNGRDALSGGSGNDRLLGEADNDALAGGNDTDTLDGGTGRDALVGNSGNDALDGGAQTDACIGGAGTDTALNCEVTGSVP